ncbi:16S rRNA (uracil(1498)-N(3))-methyltransferase [uncultured Thomasclavelia sp.]|uniref:16S rRNA (uracil(1498)-N(3))-methyltransferase n=1 Tax=uncultured Thomasclavelia sp. TaxID=3025759 RepID=UPI0025DC5CE0|nr:16S rRNA (uracil(1498)-N(3))-methyltransferase [uncultured Thomasclavelia sp.]
MQRYFIDEVIEKQEEITLTESDLHHVKNVMRMNNGDQIICLDPTGQVYLTAIKDINQGLITIIEKRDENNELDVDVTLVYALPKGDKLEMVLQKATELGVKRIVPLLTRRCVIKTNPEKFAKKMTRYHKIVKEASEQSRRNIIPEITNVITLKQLDQYLGDYNLVAYEELAKHGEDRALKQTLKQLQPGAKITIIVGCEGGFDYQEIEMMENLGIEACSLGKRILRSETAPLYFLSVIGYSREIE